jgi:hypothetical protein
MNFLYIHMCIFKNFCEKQNYLGPAEKVRIIQFKVSYWSGKSFKKQAIVNEESKVRLSPL